MGKSNMKCTYRKTIFLPFSKVRTKQYFRRKVIWFNEKHFFKLSYSFQEHWLLWTYVVLMRFVKGDHDDSSQKLGKEVRSLLEDSLGTSACDVQTLFRPCFVIYLFLLYETPPLGFYYFFACLIKIYWLELSQISWTFIKAHNSIKDPFEWYWSQSSYRVLPHWHMESILNYRGWLMVVLNFLWWGWGRCSWDNRADYTSDVSSFIGMLLHHLCVWMLIHILCY